METLKWFQHWKIPDKSGRRGNQTHNLPIAYLLSDPLGNDVVCDDDDAGARDEPERVEAEEGVVEAALLGVVLQGEEGGVDEHAPPGCS